MAVRTFIAVQSGEMSESLVVAGWWLGLVCQMYEYVLSELEPWCLAEQDFCVRFFNLTAGSDEDSAQVSQCSA